MQKRSTYCKMCKTQEAGSCVQENNCTWTQRSTCYVYDVGLGWACCYLVYYNYIIRDLNLKIIMPCDFVPERGELKTFRKLDVHKSRCLKRRKSGFTFITIPYNLKSAQAEHGQKCRIQIRCNWLYCGKLRSRESKLKHKSDELNHLFD